jgi:hypothetical protein
MLQSRPHRISPALPNFSRAPLVGHLPNIMQTGMTQADDTEEVVEEVEERPPTEVRVPRWVSVSLENPVGRYRGKLLVGNETGSRP